MGLRAAARVLGLLLIALSATLLAPIAVALIYQDGEALHFAETMALITGLGLPLWLHGRGSREELRARNGFLIVALSWIAFGFLSALPFLWGPPHLSFTDAVFEAVSGITTTGATVIVGLDALPPSTLFYRAQLQWLGGMGIVVLAVAILPFLGVGGMQLYRAEIPGPMKEEKLTPRIGQTARALWTVYLGLTVLCALAYWLAGMSVFDAVSHSFTTISTGGFSTHDASLAHFDSPLIEGIAVVFMLAGGVNFALHFVAWRGLSVRPYLEDLETRALFFLLGVITVALAANLVVNAGKSDLLEATRHALFHVASVITTTGYTTTGFADWPMFAPALMVFVMIVGASAGSTAGGIKVIRIVVLFLNGLRQMRQLIHPRAILPIRIGGQVLSDRVSAGIWGFFALYIFLFGLTVLLLMATGLDQVSAFSAVASCMSNVGPGLGVVAVTFVDLSDAATWISTWAMLLGRLELFPVLVLLMPEFWRY